MLITDKKHMAELFHHHFIKSGFLFDSPIPPLPSNISTSPTLSNVTIHDASPSFPPAPLQSFSLQAVTESEVQKELLKLDPQNHLILALSLRLLPLSSPSLSPTFLNLSLLSGEVQIAWKAATVHPLFKEGDQADSNCYRPIYILPC
jgi:hypothetical protein